MKVLLDKLSQAKEDTFELRFLHDQNSRLDDEQANFILESSFPLKNFAKETFNELREVFWGVHRQVDGVNEEMFSKFEGKLSRILEQRNIAIAKFKMREGLLDDKMVKMLSIKEGITIGPLEIELDFEIDQNHISKFNEQIKDLKKAKTDEKEIQKRSDKLIFELAKIGISENEKILPEEFISEGFSARTESLTLEEFQEKVSSEISELSEEKIAAEQFPISNLRLSLGQEDIPVKEAVHYRKLYPEWKAPPRCDWQKKLEEEEKLNLKKQKRFVSISFKLDHEKDAEILRKLTFNFCSIPKYKKDSLLNFVVGLKFLDKEKPFELSSLRWHQIMTEKAPDLMPWLTDSQKNLLGVDDESRYKDDPVSTVEEDVFSAYWRDVGYSLSKGIEKGIRCDFLISSSSRLALANCEQNALKHFRGAFCYLQKLHRKRRINTILKSAHVHGKAKDHIEEIIYRRKYVLVLPLSQKFKLERISQDVISTGSAVILKWKENL